MMQQEHQPPRSAERLRASERRAHARTRQDAEIEKIVRVLRSYGVLTRARLGEICGSAHWPDSGFKAALRRAVSSGRVRRLGDDLYEVPGRRP